MDAQEIISYIASAPKKTPVRVFVREREGASVDYGPEAHVFGAGDRDRSRMSMPWRRPTTMPLPERSRPKQLSGWMKTI